MSEVWERLEDSIIDLAATLPAIVIGLLVIGAFVYVAGKTRLWTMSLAERGGRSVSVSLLLGRMARIGMISLGILLALTIALPSFKPSELIGLLGISSVAIGFAFRDILENFLAGLLILLTDPFKINDQIVVDDFEGTVEDIQMRATYVRTYDNRLVVIPNAKLFTGSLIVNTAYGYRRSEYDVGIGYEDDIAAAQELMMRVMKESEGVLISPEPDTIMMEMGDSAIVIRVRWWSDARQADVLRVQDRVLRGIKNELTANGFNIPFPIRTVYLNHVNGVSEAA